MSTGNAIYEALISMLFRPFLDAPFVDIVGVTGSIPVTPTIHIIET